MLKLKENTGCYATPFHRELLIRIFDNETIKNNFFLTGGTALSVFYLHHRISIDLDLFTTKQMPLSDINLWITRNWPGGSKIINQSEFILQLLIKNIKVDIVYDPLSFDEPREKYFLDENKFVSIDTLRNIVSNKLAALVSRREIKDLLDFFFLSKKIKNMDFDVIYANARKKEGMFDDPPTVSYQLEANVEFVKENPEIIPETLNRLDTNEFYAFYEKLIDKIYHYKTS